MNVRPRRCSAIACLAICSVEAHAAQAGYLPEIRWTNPARPNSGVVIKDSLQNTWVFQRIDEDIAICVTLSAYEDVRDFVSARADVSDDHMTELAKKVRDRMQRYCRDIPGVYGRVRGTSREYFLDWSILTPALRRAVYLHDFNAASFISGTGYSNLKQFRPDDYGFGWSTHLNIVDCLVNSSPAVADSAIRAKYGSKEEAKALLELSKFLPTCSDPDGTLKTYRELVRRALSESVYSHAVGATTSTKRRSAFHHLSDCEGRSVLEGPCPLQ